MLPTIRAPRPDDLPALERIYLEVRGEIQNDTHVGFAADTDGERVLVAELGGRVVGFASVWEEQHFLHHLYVARDARGRGVGSALLEAATADAVGQAWLKTDPENHLARAFYARRGWVEEPGHGSYVVLRRTP